MTDTRDQILIIDIDPAHLSDREKALRAIYGQRAAESLVMLDGPPRPADVELPKKLSAPKVKFERAPKREPYRKEQSASLQKLLRK